MQRKETPWGYEEILESNKHYVIKRLVVYAGKRLSKQYHEKKTETLIPLNGVGYVGIKDKLITFNKKYHEHYEPITIKPKCVHRITGWIHSDENAVFLEVSTPEIDDVVRLEDDYGRVK